MADREVNRIVRLDWFSLLVTGLLICVGVSFIYSAGYDQASNKWAKQLVYLVPAGIVYVSVAVFNYRQLSDVAVIPYVVSLILLVLVFVIGKEINGATRWIDLKVMDFQPSEIAKPALVLLIASYLSDPMRNARQWRTVFAVLCMTVPPFVLIASQPDLGTAMVLIPIAISMLFVAGLPWRVLGFLGLAGVFFSPVVWFFLLKPHQIERILTFLNPERDPTGAGWNKIQSEIAVASGGFSGKGFLEGIQNILGYLPRSVAPTDFIYSVISEEKGFIGSATVLVLFALLLATIARTATRTQDSFGRFVCVGILAMMFSHIAVNVAMTIGLMPITGLPLPLISYGGSFMVSTLLALGLVQSVYVRRS